MEQVHFNGVVFGDDFCIKRMLKRIFKALDGYESTTH